jgi:hypothetical protein
MRILTEQKVALNDFRVPRERLVNRAVSLFAGKLDKSSLRTCRHVLANECSLCISDRDLVANVGIRLLVSHFEKGKE